ncbi:MAG: hypothetical protein DI536_09580 [Archangium gephyra]|uniref:Abnormal spindle-like microcephaly-associated protein ASH domain-containing protein n=1 Tax=Archangium gephyra TaxID=48 RepID=A0A2W5TMI3_9BACT|nr:MAG: hypothetical protein DI536_09580 [Archangium gephyra]
MTCSGPAAQSRVSGAEMRFASSLALTTLLFAACRCQDDTTPAEPALEWLLDPAVAIDDVHAKTTLGRTVFNNRVERRVAFRNAGSGSAQLLLQGGVEGLTAELEHQRVGPGEQSSVKVTFAPEAGGAQLRDYEATFTVNSLDLTVNAVGVSQACDLPAELSFGAVRIGESRRESLSLHNTTASAVEANWASPRPASLSSVFILRHRERTVEIAPEASAAIELDFAPADVQEYLAAIDVRLSEDCPLQAVRLSGRGVLDYLTWTPSPLDCGHVEVGASARRTLTFFNASAQSITLSNLVPTSTEFVISQSELTVGAASSASLEVDCQPQSLGLREARLQFSSSLSTQPTGSVELRAIGGGPDIDVRPVPVNFGRVAFQSGDGGISSRRVRISNVGNVGIGSLHVEQPTLASSSSAWVVGPLENYDSDAGIAAVAAEYAWFDVRFRPAAPGVDSATIRLMTNDGDEPVVEIPITAFAVEAGQCELSVEPAQLDFGVVRPGGRASLPLVLTNTSTDGTECFLSSIDTSDPHFHLVGGRREQEILASGQSLNLTIQFEAPNTVTPTVSAELSFHVSASNSPRSVNLRGAVFDSCLTVQPNPARWPDTPIACSSSQSVVLYNLCEFPVSYTGASVLTDGGWQVASVDAGIQIGAGATLAVPLLFSPTTISPYAGDLRVNYFDGSPGSRSQIVALVGAGVAGTPITERLFAPVEKKGDYIYCGSISELDDDESSRSLREFYFGIVDAGVDFHLIRVLEYWEYYSFQEGMLGFVYPPPLGSAIPAVDGGPPMIFTRDTDGGWPLLRQTMISPVGIGDPRQCLESVRRALRVHDQGLNAGFRRPNTPLNVLINSYGDDQSSTVRPPPWFGTMAPISYYKSELLAGMDNNLSLLRISAGGTSDTMSACPENPRHREMVDWTGGALLDFCTSNQSGLYDAFLANSLSLQRRFTLRAEPSMSAPIEVRVDGGTVSWTWVSQGRYIELTQPPPPGAPVDITYTPACSP